MSGQPPHLVPAFIDDLVDAAIVAQGAPLARDVHKAADAHWNVLAAATHQAFADGRTIEHVVTDEPLRLLRTAAEARRHRMALDDGDDVEAEALAEDVETRAVDALLTWADLHLPR